MALIRKSFAVGPLGCNCSIVACRQTHQGLVVDPGGDAPKILQELARLGISAVSIIHTHAHFDHIMGTSDVAAATGAEIVLHADDRWLYDNLEMQAGMFGMTATAATPPGRELQGGEKLSFGRHEALTLHTPGHTPGSLCFFVEAPGETPIVFSGDTLFARSIGRTDLWGGSHEQIIKSIQNELFHLPEDTLVIPGHGPATTIGAERAENPFVGG